MTGNNVVEHRFVTHYEAAPLHMGPLVAQLELLPSCPNQGDVQTWAVGARKGSRLCNDAWGILMNG